MTREEKAIMYFKDMRKRLCEDYLNICPKDSIAYKATLAEKDFYDSAIQALEQEPCGDMEEIREVMGCDADAETKCKMISNILTAKPHYFEEPKPRWIPVSERLPEECERVLMFYERNAWGDNGSFRKKTIDIGWHVDGMWHVDGCSGVVGIAWMPLPQPYAESEEKE